MIPSEKSMTFKGTEYLFLHSHPPKNGIEKGELIIRKSDGSLVSIHAEMQSRLKKAPLDSFVLEAKVEKGKEYFTIDSLEAKNKLGDDFSLIKQIGKNKLNLKEANLEHYLPESDRHLGKIFQRAMTEKASELSPQTIDNSVRINHTYTINKGDILLHVNEKLGEGGFKTVKLAKSIFSNEYLVIAHLKASVETKKQIENLANEYDLHKKFQGIGLMKGYDFIVYKNKKTSGQHAILAAYYPTDMKKVVLENHVMPQKTQAKAMLEVSLALAKMHQENYAHLDIKPDNIYLQWHASDPENIEVGLGDFGEVKELTQKNFRQMDAWAGTPDYHSPERYAKVYRAFASSPELCQLTFQMDLGSLTKANDIYALGKVFLELTSGKLMTFDEGVEFAKKEKPQDPLHALAWEMMRIELKERPNIVEVIQILQAY